MGEMRKILSVVFSVAVLVVTSVSCSVRSASNPPASAVLETGPFSNLSGKLVFVQGGCYEMGDVFGEGVRTEGPVHKVCVDDYYLGQNEVTQKQWMAVMGDNPAVYSDCENCPVERVSWDDAHVFVQKLNEKTGLNFRLPTEAEWEYACRERGRKVRFGHGKDTIGPDEANINAQPGYKTSYSRAGVYRDRTVAVGSFAPSMLQLYDMTGNIFEWVEDDYGVDAYKHHGKRNPLYKKGGTYRVARGGCFRDEPEHARCTVRASLSTDFRWRYLGFRLAHSR
jgi:formylglycine-generating enzyme required for sulfatase activity